MNMQTAMALGAGLLGAVGARAEAAQTRTLRARPVANIHIDMRTGARTAHPFDARPRSASSAPLWISNNTDPCLTGGTVGLLDDPDTDGDTFGDLFGSPATGGTFPLEGTWNLWWGDIGADSVVDCVVIAYGTLAPDTDTNGDSIGDGIVGFDLALTLSDSDNGFGADQPFPSGRACLFDLTIPTLPGALPDLPPGYAAVYLLTLDFAGNVPAPSLSFELGDSNGVDDAGSGISGGAIYGFPTFNDIDGDTLGDFSWAYRFDQSSLPPERKGASGFLAVADFLGNPGDTHPSAPATGLFDAMDVYEYGPSCPPGPTPPYIAGLWSGFSCAAGTPFASSYLELYGPACSCGGCLPPGACSLADIALPVGVLDFADLLAFLTDFGSNGFCSDLAPPVGTWDFSDVIAFLAAFGEGCP